MIVGVDPRRVAIGKRDLNRVIPYLRRSLGARLGLEHGQRRRRRHSRRGVGGCFFVALVIAGRAGTFVAQIREIVMAHVAVGPRNVHAGTTGNVNLDASRLFARIEGSRHASGVFRLSFFRCSSRLEE